MMMMMILLTTVEVVAVILFLLKTRFSLMTQVNTGSFSRTDGKITLCTRLPAKVKVGIYTNE